MSIVANRVSVLARSRSLANVCAVAAICAAAGIASAHLGGFENKDGYQPFLNMVQNYNAGQYGISSGYIAMSPTPITPGSGLWHAINGGFSSGGGISYVTGHQFYDRTYVNSGGTSGLSSDQGLVITTGHEGVGGPALKYKYDVDSSDLGGVSPGSTGSGIVQVSFWSRGFLDSGNVGPGYFGNEIRFEDSAGNVGFNLGLTKTSGGDMVTYWDGTSTLVSGIFAAPNLFDRWDITLDMATDTVSADYYQFSTNTTYNLINNVAMSSAMSDFSHMTFRSTPGTYNAKFWAVDDFSFHTNLPTPGSLGVLGLGAIATLRRRR